MDNIFGVYYDQELKLRVQAGSVVGLARQQRAFHKQFGVACSQYSQIKAANWIHDGVVAVLACYGL